MTTSRFKCSSALHVKQPTNESEVMSMPLKEHPDSAVPNTLTSPCLLKAKEQVGASLDWEIAYGRAMFELAELDDLILQRQKLAKAMYEAGKRDVMKGGE